MSTNKTTHYGLHLWEPEDKFVRTEFNENSEKIETAIQGARTAASQAVNQVAAVKCEMKFGAYAGDGAASRYIEVGFAPKAVIVDREDGVRDARSISGGLALVGHPVTSNGRQAVTITGTGFMVSCYMNETYTNQNGSNYRYLAFR